MEKSSFPILKSWTLTGVKADVWLVELREYVGTILPALLHRMIGNDEVERLLIPALEITEILVMAPENLNNEANRARAKMYTDEQALIRRVTMAVQQALPDQELANLKATTAAGVPFTLTTLYTAFKNRRCIRNPMQASKLKNEIEAIAYRMGDDVEGLIGQIRILDSALDAAADGVYARGEESKVHGLLGTLKNWPHRDTWIKDLRGHDVTFKEYADMAVLIQYDLPIEEGFGLNAVASGPTAPVGSEVKKLQDKIGQLEATIARLSTKSTATRNKPTNPCHKHPEGVHTWQNCSENPESANYGKSYGERRRTKK